MTTTALWDRLTINPATVLLKDTLLLHWSPGDMGLGTGLGPALTNGVWAFWGKSLLMRDAHPALLRLAALRDAAFSKAKAVGKTGPWTLDRSGRTTDRQEADLPSLPAVLPAAGSHVLAIEPGSPQLQFDPEHDVVTFTVPTPVTSRAVFLHPGHHPGHPYRNSESYSIQSSGEDLPDEIYESFEELGSDAKISLSMAAYLAIRKLDGVLSMVLPRVSFPTAESDPELKKQARITAISEVGGRPLLITRDGATVVGVIMPCRL